MLRPTSVLAYAKPPSPQGEGFGRCKPSAPTAPHPAGIMIPATFPQGKASLRRVGTLLQPPTVHPLSLPLQADSSPYTGEPYTPPVLRMELKRAGHAAAPTRKNDPASRPYTRSSLFSFLFSLIKIMPLPELSSGERSPLYFVPKMRSPASPRPGMM